MSEWDPPWPSSSNVCLLPETNSQNMHTVCLLSRWWWGEGWDAEWLGKSILWGPLPPHPAGPPLSSLKLSHLCRILNMLVMHLYSLSRQEFSKVCVTCLTNFSPSVLSFLLAFLPSFKCMLICSLGTLWQTPIPVSQELGSYGWPHLDPLWHIFKNKANKTMVTF